VYCGPVTGRILGCALSLVNLSCSRDKLPSRRSKEPTRGGVLRCALSRVNMSCFYDERSGIATIERASRGGREPWFSVEARLSRYGIGRDVL
jgi:hypothetical protein